tara:strand:+ start:941 stop:1282 length:342 start_codon:yes stop_codon:yes gene_type:complete
MKTNFKMKEATNASEAIFSIENVLIENPVWLNKCTSDLFAVVKQCWDLPMIKTTKPLIECDYTGWSEDAIKDAKSYHEHKVSMLSMLNSEQIINLFIEIKTEYYNFLDNTQWS